MAAERGDRLAQSNLGLMLSQGRGTPEDLAEATTWCVQSTHTHTRAHTSQYSYTRPSLTHTLVPQSHAAAKGREGGAICLCAAGHSCE